MNRLLLISFVAVVFYLLGRDSNLLQVKAEGDKDGEKALPPCKDVNADGNADITDAVFLLNWLFLGGPEPVCPPPDVQSIGLPDAGQMLCYDTGGSEIPCDSDTWPGQDGFYESGCSPEVRFFDNQDGTVTDTCTGLMWQQETAPGMFTWQEALDYCENDLRLAEYEDWRLPDIRELQSIVDYSRFGPAIDPIFNAFTSPGYWSSTTNAIRPNEAWTIGFNGGNVLNFPDADKVNLRYVRAVRTIQIQVDE